MPDHKTTPQTFLFQTRYNDTVVKFQAYTDALRWCRDASKQGIKNVVIEKVKSDNPSVLTH